MMGRLIAASLTLLIGSGLIGLLIWDHHAQRQAWVDAQPGILRASDINALAEAMGCPQRGVSGDLVKPLIEQLTTCAKAKLCLDGL